MKLRSVASVLCGVVLCTAFASVAFGAAAAQDDAKKTKAEGPMVMNLYPLATCPVSGNTLGENGEAVIKEYEGREVRFCCAGCVEPFEKDTARFMAKIDEQIIASQGRFYPMETCMVMEGQALKTDGEFDGQNVVVNNRLFQTCCKRCAAHIRKDASPWMAKLNDAVVAQQREHYPLESCIVMADSKLGGMGDPVEIIAANRLVKFCCEGCVPAFRKDPAKYISRLDDAWMKAHAAADGEGH